MNPGRIKCPGCGGQVSFRLVLYARWTERAVGPHDVIVWDLEDPTIWYEVRCPWSGAYAGQLRDP